VGIIKLRDLRQNVNEKLFFARLDRTVTEKRAADFINQPAFFRHSRKARFQGFNINYRKVI
jgi:hypothetical protein